MNNQLLSLVFSDLHIHNYKDFSVDDSRLNNCLDVIKTAYKFCDSNGIDLILFPGDLYHNQVLLPTKVVNRTIEVFKDCVEKYPHIVFCAITGNHDFATKNLIDRPGESALTHLSTIAPTNFRLLDNQSLDTKCGVVIHGIPYYEYPEDFSIALDKAVEEAEAAKQRGVQILMVHQTPNEMGNDLIPYDIDVNDPRLKTFDYIYCGHIHRRAQITDNFLLVGNPQHKDLSDAGNEKGFILTDLTAPREWRLVSTRGRYPEYKRVAFDEEVPSDTIDYIVPDVAPITNDTEPETIENFGNRNTPKELVTNYWKEVDGQDKERLSVGLKMLSI